METHTEDFGILACTVLIQCQGVTVWQRDRRMDRRTDGCILLSCVKIKYN